MQELKESADYTTIESFLKRENLTLALKALDFASQFHTHRRKDGTPEFGHQIFISNYIIQAVLPRLRYPDETLAAIFLHDTVEDYRSEVSFEDIRNNFNSIVVDILKPVTKKESFQKNEEDYDEYYENIIKCRGSIVVKAADRIHNLQSMVNVFPIERQLKYILEVELYILPMLDKATEIYFEYKEVYAALSHTIKRQLIFLREILKRDEEILALKSQLA